MELRVNVSVPTVMEFVVLTKVKQVMLLEFMVAVTPVPVLAFMVTWELKTLPGRPKAFTGKWKVLKVAAYMGKQRLRRGLPLESMVRPTAVMVGGLLV